MLNPVEIDLPSCLRDSVTTFFFFLHVILTHLMNDKIERGICLLLFIVYSRFR